MRRSGRAHFHFFQSPRVESFKSRSCVHGSSRSPRGPRPRRSRRRWRPPSPRPWLLLLPSHSGWRPPPTPRRLLLPPPSAAVARPGRRRGRTAPRSAVIARAPRARPCRWTMISSRWPSCLALCACFWTIGCMCQCQGRLVDQRPDLAVLGGRHTFNFHFSRYLARWSGWRAGVGPCRCGTGRGSRPSPVLVGE